MKFEALIENLPLWGLFAFTAAIVVGSIEAGFQLGRRRARAAESETESAVSSMVGASLGLLAFLLAFTFGLAASRYEVRREALLNEVNAIGTTYLRTATLPSPHPVELRKLLREYVAVRVEGVRSGRVAEAIRRSEALHNELWAKAAELGQEYPNSIVVGLFIEALNEVIDLHTERVTASLRSRIPGAIWLSLYSITILAMAELGYQSGLAGKRRSLAIPGVAFAFAAVIILIADLDRPGEGMITISQQGMHELRDMMNATQP